MPRRDVRGRQRLTEDYLEQVVGGRHRPAAKLAAPVAEPPALESAGEGRIRVAWADLPVRALYRANPAAAPVSCEIVAKKGKGRLVLREVDRPLAGVWLARRDQVSPPLHVDREDFASWLRLNLLQLGAL